MKFIRPHDMMDCGISCLRMICDHYGKNYSAHYLRRISYLTRQGISLLTLGKAAESLGMKAMVGELTPAYLSTKATLPCILYWDKSHFVVLDRIRKRRNGKTVYYIIDPAHGKVKLKAIPFLKYWVGESAKGIALFLEPTPEFFEKEELPGEKKGEKGTWSFLWFYFSRFRKNYLHVIISMLLAASISLFIPYLTKGIIDIGVGNKDLGFITMIILFQLFLFVGNTFAEIVRSHLLLYIGARINTSIRSDFLLKLMKLPLSFFEAKLVGDILQRIGDHSRIESFINTTILNTLFSFVNMGIFLFVLLGYDFSIVTIFVIGSTASISWTLLFMRWRRSLDYIRFRELSVSGDKLYELVNGMPEIKLNSFEKYKQWEWEEIQVRLFKVNVSNLKLDQYQKIGSAFLDQIKNVLITFVAAKGVIDGSLTIGTMLAISYITGQLNVPIRQVSEFINSFQFSKLAIERMNEVYAENNEEDDHQKNELRAARVTQTGDIEVRNVSFQYEGPQSPFVLRNLSLTIPKGKITAIVGSSGSGKTTLLKLLLKFYSPSQGNILINGLDASQVSAMEWREQCGTVLQDGYIFSDSIKRNIMMADESDDMDRLIYSTEMAHIDDLIAEQPLLFDTRIGSAGVGLSAGQKQRILIARAVYKDPEYLFFDEATSALDARNERIIMHNLHAVFKGKTVVIIAHRLSTVKHADQIIVLEKGEIVETGTHRELVNQEGPYFNLIRNQLELGA
jgi:ATP-binding cassette subfamily B protein